MARRPLDIIPRGRGSAVRLVLAAGAVALSALAARLLAAPDRLHGLGPTRQRRMFSVAWPPLFMALAAAAAYAWRAGRTQDEAQAGEDGAAPWRSLARFRGRPEARPTIH